MAERSEPTIYVKWVRSGIGFPRRQKVAVCSLGLRRLHQVVERPDTPQVRGLVASVTHLVAIVEKPQKAAWHAVPVYKMVAKPVVPAPQEPETPAEAEAAEPTGEASASN